MVSGKTSLFEENASFSKIEGGRPKNSLVSPPSIVIVYPSNGRQVPIALSPFSQLRLKPAHWINGCWVSQEGGSQTSLDQFLVSEKTDEMTAYVPHEQLTAYLQTLFAGSALKEALRHGVTVEELVKRRIIQLLDRLQGWNAQLFAENAGIQQLFNITDGETLKNLFERVIKVGVRKVGLVIDGQKLDFATLMALPTCAPQFGGIFQSLKNGVPAKGIPASFTDKALYVFIAILHHEFGHNIFRSQILRDQRLLLFNYGTNFRPNQQLKEIFGNIPRIVDLEVTQQMSHLILDQLEMHMKKNSRLILPQHLKRAKRMFSVAPDNMERLDRYLQILENTYAMSVVKRLNAIRDSDKTGTDQMILVSLDEDVMELSATCPELSAQEAEVIRLILQCDSTPHRLILVEDKKSVKPRKSDFLSSKELPAPSGQMIEMTSLSDFGVGHLLRMFTDNKRYVRATFAGWLGATG